MLVYFNLLLKNKNSDLNMNKKNRSFSALSTPAHQQVRISRCCHQSKWTNKVNIISRQVIIAFGKNNVIKQ